MTYESAVFDGRWWYGSLPGFGGYTTEWLCPHKHRFRYRASECARAELRRRRAA